MNLNLVLNGTTKISTKKKVIYYLDQILHAHMFLISVNFNLWNDEIDLEPGMVTRATKN